MERRGWRSHLSQVQGDVDLVVLGAPGEGRALPPALCPVYGVGDGVGAVTVPHGTYVTVLALRDTHTDTHPTVSDNRLSIIAIETQVTLHTCNAQI